MVFAPEDIVTLGPLEVPIEEEQQQRINPSDMRQMCTGRYDAGCVLAGTPPDVYWQVRRRMCTGRYDAGCVLATT